jgi:methyl-accepting chemotaxis protein
MADKLLGGRESQPRRFVKFRDTAARIDQAGKLLNSLNEDVVELKSRFDSAHKEVEECFKTVEETDDVPEGYKPLDEIIDSSEQIIKEIAKRCVEEMLKKTDEISGAIKRSRIPTKDLSKVLQSDLTQITHVVLKAEMARGQVDIDEIVEKRELLNIVIEHLQNYLNENLAIVNLRQGVRESFTKVNGMWIKAGQPQDLVILYNEIAELHNVLDKRLSDYKFRVTELAPSTIELAKKIQALGQFLSLESNSTKQ